MSYLNKSLVQSAIFKPYPFSEDSAWLGHLQFAYFLIKEHQPKLVVELGSHWGHSYFALCKAIKETEIECSAYAVDTWEGDTHAGYYGGNVFEFVDSHNQEYYKSFSKLLRMNFDEAVSYFNDDSIDLLHIDGLHTYEAVKHDFETWLPKLAPGAIVIFHDTNVRERGFGVWKFWEELCVQYQATINFTHSHGLGVLQLPSLKPEMQHEWLGLKEKDKTTFKEYFSSIGTLEQLRYQLVIAGSQLKKHGDELEAVNQQLNLQVETNHSLEQKLKLQDEQLKAMEAENEKKLSENAERSVKLNQEINLQSDRNALMERELTKQERELESLRVHNETILNSKSWKVTAPLRAAAKLRRKAKKLTWLTMKILKEHGFRKTFWKFAEISKVSGLKGLKRRVIAEYLTANAVNSITVINHSGESLNKLELKRDSSGIYTLQNCKPSYVYIEPEKPSDILGIIASLSKKPMFSIVVPVFNTEVWMLESAIRSVENQWYPHWELIIVNDASSKDETINLLSVITSDCIKVINLKKNIGIANATNLGIEECNGDFVVFMDHDDELTPDCLYELAIKIDQDNSDYVYSDEDKISRSGVYIDPHFKPDWSPDTLMSIMYTSHVSCIRRSLVDEVGGLNSELDGCQDWDLVLRITEKTNRISHVPKVLYHWRILEGSVALSLNAKPYVEEATIKLKKEALARRNRKANLEKVPGRNGYWRVNYLPQQNPLVSIIIPTRDNYQILRTCLESISRKTIYSNYEIVIIDNGSEDAETIRYLKNLKWRSGVEVVEHSIPFNFSVLCNVGAKNSRGDVLLFLNDDIEVITCDWLERLCGYAQLPHVGAVGAKLLYPGERYIQHCGIVNSYDGPGHAFLRKPRDYDGYFLRTDIEYNWSAVTGACLMVEKDKFYGVGGFDETFPIAYNDVDICFSLLERGYFNVLSPGVELIHHESLSRGSDDVDPIKRKRLSLERKKLFGKHPKFFSHDPFYNPNFKSSPSYFESF